RAGATGNSADGVIDAHDGVRLRLHNRGLESHQVSVHQVILAHGSVEDVPLRLRTTVYGVVFRSRDYFKVVRIVALHPLYEFDAHATGEIRIFPVRFLPSSPAGIAKDIDVRRPVGQSGGTTGRCNRRVAEDRRW